MCRREEKAERRSKQIQLALIAVYAISWVLLPVVAQVGAALGVTLGKRQVEFTDARTDIINQCPESCRGDLSVPQCQLE